MAAVTICSDFEAHKIKSDTVSNVSPSICHKVIGLDAIILVFWMLSFKPAAGVQLQQPGIQPEEMDGVGDDDVASGS